MFLDTETAKILLTKCIYCVSSERIAAPAAGKTEDRICYFLEMVRL